MHTPHHTNLGVAVYTGVAKLGETVYTGVAKLGVANITNTPEKFIAGTGESAGYN